MPDQIHVTRDEIPEPRDLITCTRVIDPHDQMALFHTLARK